MFVECKLAHVGGSSTLLSAASDDRRHRKSSKGSSSSRDREKNERDCTIFQVVVYYAEGRAEILYLRAKSATDAKRWVDALNPDTSVQPTWNKQRARATVDYGAQHTLSCTKLLMQQCGCLARSVCHLFRLTAGTVNDHVILFFFFVFFCIRLDHFVVFIESFLFVFSFFPYFFHFLFFIVSSRPSRDGRARVAGWRHYSRQRSRRQWRAQGHTGARGKLISPSKHGVVSRVHGDDAPVYPRERDRKKKARQSAEKYLLKMVLTLKMMP